MKKLENMAKQMVSKKFQELVKHEVRIILDEAAKQAIKDISDQLRFKFIPQDNGSIKVEAFWDEVPIE